MKSGYVYLTENELKFVSSLLKTSKSVEAKNLVEKITYYDKKTSAENAYKVLAFEKIRKMDENLVNNEEFFIDDDALVSEDKNGAYVHTWLYVENKPKAKRTRKKAS
jgi:hypothetical protein